MSEIQMVIATVPRKTGWSWSILVDGERVQHSKHVAPSEAEARKRAKDALVAELQRRLGPKQREHGPARPKISVRLECGHVRKVRPFAGDYEQRVECAVCGDIQAVVAELPTPVK